MQSYIITAADKGQRFDKYIHRRLPSAPASFIYKMLRKKNITLNGHKASGSEIVQPGDEVKMFLSDETAVKFGGVIGQPDGSAYDAEKVLDARQAYRQMSRRYPGIRILYEDRDIAAVYKPSDVLSQKAKPEDLSLNEWFLGELLEKGEVTEPSLRMFTPSVQNRLDRNTEGIVLLAKTLQGSHLLTGLQREEKLGKYYQMIVIGRVPKAGVVEGWLSKDSASNTVKIYPEEKAGTVYTRTEYTPLGYASECRNREQHCGSNGGSFHKTVPTKTVPTQKPRQNHLPLSFDQNATRSQRGDSFHSHNEVELTLLDARLVTGKSHQLRAHMASIGHPILGDPKYGDAAVNRQYRERFGVTRQLLICERVVFPGNIGGDFAYLSGKLISCELPKIYERVMTE